MIKAVALADAEHIKATGFAEAEKVRALGLAEAEATEKKVAAFGGPDYQLNAQVLMRFAEAIENGRLPLVPQIQIGASGGERGGCQWPCRNDAFDTRCPGWATNLPDAIPEPVEED